jgi:hypothetical protein
MEFVPADHAAEAVHRNACNPKHDGEAEAERNLAPGGPAETDREHSGANNGGENATEDGESRSQILRFHLNGEDCGNGRQKNREREEKPIQSPWRRRLFCDVWRADGRCHNPKLCAARLSRKAKSRTVRRRCGLRVSSARFC